MSNACWACGENIPALTFCLLCKKIQSPKNKEDAFQCLGLAYRFDLDINLLQKTYFQRQAEVHPDRFIQASPQEKAYAEQHTTIVNQAYAQLKDPIYRAEILLKQQGLSINAQAQEVLIMTMIWQEKIENTKALEALHQLQEELNQACQHTYNQLISAFEFNHMEDAPILAGTLQYLLKVQQQLQQKMAYP